MKYFQYYTMKTAYTALPNASNANAQPGPFGTTAMCFPSIRRETSVLVPRLNAYYAIVTLSCSISITFDIDQTSG